MGKARADADPAMVRVQALAKESGLTLHELGLKMGYRAESARKSVWQFLRTGDPRIGMLRRFASAMGMDLKELL